jgi:phosphoribosylanthranilate isomerase
MPVEIKICGLTDPAEARACAEAGADAIGLVFHPSSPRNLDPVRARAISDSLPPRVARVGVFADADADTILRIAAAAGLTALQLHGSGSLAALPRLLGAPYRVIAVLRSTAGLIQAARALPETVGILVECGRGVLPGGNGAVWEWAAAAPLAAVRPFALAGGLSPDTVVGAVRDARAAGVDISSGVESSPGRKDVARVRLLISRLTAASADLSVPAGSVFRSPGR